MTVAMPEPQEGLFALVPADRAASIWAAVAPILRPAIRRTGGQFDEAGVLDLVRTGKMQLWVLEGGQGIRAVVTTAVLNYVGMRVLAIPLMAGTGMPQWLAGLEAVLTEHGRQQACAMLESYVRPGLIGASYNEQRARIKDAQKCWTMVRKPIAP